MASVVYAQGSHNTVTKGERVLNRLSYPGQEGRVRGSQSFCKTGLSAYLRSCGLKVRLPIKQGPAGILHSDFGGWALSFSSHLATPQSARISQKGAFTYILVSGFLHVVLSFLWLLPRDTPRSSDSKNMASGPIISWQIEGEKVEAVTDFIFLGSKITADSDCRCEMKRYLLLGRKAMTKLDKSIKKQRHHFASKGLYGKSYGFSSSQVQMWELDHKEGWVMKNWCFQIVVPQKTLESPLNCKEIKSVSPKETNSEYSLERLLLATWREELIQWKTPWCWERLKAKGKEGSRGWDGWTASLTR